MENQVEERFNQPYTDHARVATPKSANPATKYIVVVSAAPLESAATLSSHDSVSSPSSGIGDRLDDATWEDAEWR